MQNEIAQSVPETLACTVRGAHDALSAHDGAQVFDLTPSLSRPAKRPLGPSRVRPATPDELRYALAALHG